MRPRSDHLHSHQFTLQRVIGALAMHDPDPTTSPMRRIGGALSAGVMLAALALAAVGVYGVVRPGGNSSWRIGDAVIIERETGARFVYREGLLHPVANYSSALLILGSAQPKTAHVSRASLADVARGAPLGILGAPDLLPERGELTAAAWTLCSRARSVGSGAALPASESVLLIGSEPAGARQPLDGAAVLAEDPVGGLHLIWNHRRFAIRHPTVVLTAFAWRGQRPTPVAAAVLNSVPAGPDVEPIHVDSGKASALAGARVGQVYYVENQSGATQYGVALADGLADITQIQADLLLADNPDIGATAKAMTQARYATAPRARSLIPAGDSAPPSRTPELASPSSHGGVCTSFADGGPGPEVAVAESLTPGPGEVRAVESSGSYAGVGVDWVAVAPGRGAVVEALAGPSSPSGSLAFVSDLGVRHPIPTREVLAMLGYHEVMPMRLPASVVSLLPSGRALDPAAASLPVALA